MSTRKSRIEQLLQTTFQPLTLHVENESYQHQTRRSNAETHFKVTVVAEAFDCLTRIERQKQVYQLLQHELNTGLHALSMHLFTPNEWHTKTTQGGVPASPCCHLRERRDNTH